MTSGYKKDVGRRIRALRVEKYGKHGRAVLADKIDLSPQYIWDWEVGNHLPSLPNLAALAKALNASVSYILTGNCSAGGPTDATTHAASLAAAAGIVERFKALLGNELGRDVCGLHYETWKPLVPDTCLAGC